MPKEKKVKIKKLSKADKEAQKIKKIEDNRKENRKMAVEIDQKISIYQKDTVEFNDALIDFIEYWETKAP